VLSAFRFDNDHLHAFRFRDRGGRRHEVASAECEESPSTDEVELAELPIDPGMTMELEFDFGDSWRFAVKLERVEPVGAVRGKLPRVLEKEGKAPVQYGGWGD
ncbi:MAG: IS1096 element passenger TnpR family protein, partial [Gemmataceae bacterium]